MVRVGVVMTRIASMTASSAREDGLTALYVDASVETASLKLLMSPCLPLNQQIRPCGRGKFQNSVSGCGAIWGAARAL